MSYRKAVRSAETCAVINTCIGECSALGVEAERVHDAWAAVGEVQRVPIGAPIQPVGDREPLKHQRDLTSAVEPVQRPASDAVIVRERAGPEPAARVARTVIEPRISLPVPHCARRRHASTSAASYEPPTPTWAFATTTCL